MSNQGAHWMSNTENTPDDGAGLPYVDDGAGLPYVSLA